MSFNCNAISARRHLHGKPWSLPYGCVRINAYHGESIGFFRALLLCFTCKALSCANALCMYFASFQFCKMLDFLPCKRILFSWHLLLQMQMVESIYHARLLDFLLASSSFKTCIAFCVWRARWRAHSLVVQNASEHWLHAFCLRRRLFKKATRLQR